MVTLIQRNDRCNNNAKKPAVLSKNEDNAICCGHGVAVTLYTAVFSVSSVAVYWQPPSLNSAYDDQGSKLPQAGHCLRIRSSRQSGLKSE